jgi:tRNA(Ile)-lysidine synthase TilS/MesJ
VTQLLNDLFGLQLRSGCACAGPYGLRLLGMGAQQQSDAMERCLLHAASSELGEAMRPGWTRLSLSYCASDAEVSYALAAIHAVADYGYRLLPDYTFSPRSGEWKHASRATRFPDRKWLAHFAWPSEATEQPAPVPSEAQVEADLRQHLLDAERLFNAQLAAATAAPPPLPPPPSDAHRWFTLPEEAAAAMRAEAARGCTPCLLGTERRASPWASVQGWATAKPLGPVQPLAYTADGAVVPLVAFDANTQPFGHELAPEESAQPVAHRRLAHSSGPLFASPQVLSALAFGARGPPRALQESESDDESLSSGSDPAEEEAERDGDVSPPSVLHPSPAPPPPRRCVPPRKLLATVCRSVASFRMIRPGDRLLLGLSGGKDSLSLLHILLHMQARSPVRFELAAATVDPGAEGFDPRPLGPYLASLGVTHYLLPNRIMADASASMEGDSICSFCARMKRGALYSCCRREGYTTLVLGQHADDIAESLLLSAFHNGALRTMKACYAIGAGEAALRVIRPMAAVRERSLRAFAYASGMPVIPDNCPACFEAPKERARIKALLRREERAFPQLFSSLGSALQPLLDCRVPPLLRSVGDELDAKKEANKLRPKRGPAAAKEVDVSEEGDACATLAGVDTAELVRELRRRGGLAIAPEDALADAEQEEEREERARVDAAKGAACPMPRRDSC